MSHWPPPKLQIEFQVETISLEDIFQWIEFIELDQQGKLKKFGIACFKISNEGVFSHPKGKYYRQPVTHTENMSDMLLLPDYDLVCQPKTEDL